MNAYRIELLVLDHDSLGADEIVNTIENARYPNRCISPSVMLISRRQVDWSDDHPLNKTSTQHAAYFALFDTKEQP